MVAIQVPEVLIWILVGLMVFNCILSVVQIYQKQKLVQVNKDIRRYAKMSHPYRE